MDDAEKAQVFARLNELFQKIDAHIDEIYNAVGPWTIEPDEKLSLEEQISVVRKTLPGLEREIHALEFGALALFEKL